ncbi:hypothetical protein I551_1347 [Mycobacterium ulcerans str. Harvey]|uniref:Uncharacterized protein n=1 Tax=Mycobacterium ulcerans str. Harvey TaxID=1299332 RepID=A0ABN0R4Z1_MYCUL|nr:hypothetical protein I551_1347 [Mycobacterium ulcerans str. Harvey]
MDTGPRAPLIRIAAPAIRLNGRADVLPTLRALPARLA